MEFQELSRYLDTFPSMGIPGCELLIWKDHKPIFHHRTGEGRPGKAIVGDELFTLYSVTKVFTMTCMMQLVEQGKIRLTDPVAQYLPAYANLSVQDEEGLHPCKTTLTIQHLMSMQAGLDYDVSSANILACKEKYGPAVTTRQLVDSFSQKPLAFEPGTDFCYSLCHDVCAAIVEVVSGLSFGEYLKQFVFEPLGIKDMGFHPTPEQLERLSGAYIWNESNVPTALPVTENFTCLAPAYESGGGGLFGNVKEIMLLMDALANEGMAQNGHRILTKESIDALRTDQLQDSFRDSFFNDPAKLGYGYGLGVRTLIHKQFSPSNLGEFGWDGANGTWVLMDPALGLAAVYVQHVRNCWQVYQQFLPGIRSYIYQCVLGNK